MTKQNLKEQMKTLEARVALLEQSAGPVVNEPTPGLTAKEFLETFSGIFENDPIYLEAMRLGAEWRASTRPKAKPLNLQGGKRARARH